MTTFVAGLGNDTFTGSADSSDTVDYSDPSATDAGILVNLQYDPTYVGRGEGSDELISIENIIGTAFNDTVFATNGGVHTLSLGGGNDEFLTGGGGIWTLDGGDGNDFWGADYISATQNLTLAYDTATGSGSLTGGTTFSHMERIGVTFGSGNDTIAITGKLTGFNSMGSTLQTYDGDDTITMGGFSGLNHSLRGGRGFDTLNLTLTDDMNASNTYVTRDDGMMTIDVIASTGALRAEEFESVNYALDNGDNRVVFNGTSGSVHVDGRGGTDKLELDIASSGRLVNDVVWTITGSVTTASNIGFFDHFETIQLRLGGGVNVLHMGDEADKISSEAGRDTIYGGGGNDDLRANFLFNPAKAVTYHGGDDNDTLTGGAVGDQLYGDAGLDLLIGDNGSDRLDGGTGNDTMVGGAGNDIYYVDSASDVVTELTREGDDLVFSSVNYALGANVERLELGDDAGNINGTGGNGNDTIYGNAGDNVLTGGAGNDALMGRANYFGSTSWTSEAGNDTIHGGTGNDGVSGGGTAGHLASLYGDAGDDIVATATYADVDGGDGKDQLQFYFYDYAQDIGHGVWLDVSTVPDGGVVYSPGGGTVRNFETFYLTGTNFGDILISASGDDTVQGQGDNDRLEGGGGNDSLEGGTGIDTFDGGLGDDTFVVDNTAEVVTELQDQGTDTILSSATYVLDANVEVLTLTGAFVINGTGNGLDNRLNGNFNDNRLDGGLGADTLTGRYGNDAYVVDNAGDVVVEAVGEGVDTIQSLLTTTLTPNIENLLLTGSDALNGTGTATANALTGNSGANALSGLGGDDTLTGGYGDDVLDGGDGNDMLDGGQGNDSLYAGAGDDTVHGGDGYDVIYGGTGVNRLYGDAGDDYIQTQTDSYGSTYDGGDGRDTVDYSWKFGAQLVRIDLTDGTYSDDGGIETVINFESVLGTQGSDMITGNGEANSLYGYDGNDVLGGLDGDDVLNGGNGNDTIFGGATGTSAFDTVDGGEGEDLIYSSGSGTYLGGAGNDYIRAQATYGIGETLDGGLGNDTLDTTAYAGDYKIDLTLGTTNVSSGTESFIQFENVLTGGGNDSITGTGGDNQIWTGAGNDVLEGLGGNDWLVGGAGLDTLVGGLGDDTYIVEDTAAFIQESSGQGTDLVQANVSYTLGAGAYVENLILLGMANIDGKGNGLGNGIIGNSGNNRLDGSGGADTLTGGLGDDTYVLDTTGDLVVEAVGEGMDTIQASFTVTLTAAIENLILTGTATVNGIGNAGNNGITGNSGNNTLTGLGGSDWLSGGLGADTLIGGLGYDTYVVDNAGDFVTEMNGQGMDTVLSSVSFTLSNALSIEILTLTGPQHINATGNAFANTLNGNSGNNTLNGGSGADTMNGGAGHDIYVVENAGDVVVEGLNAGIDTVQSAVTYVLGDNVENLTLAGSMAINGTGNALNNTIYGNAGANLLTGGGGTDKIYGRGGNDTYIVDSVSVGISEQLGGGDAGGIDEVRASVSYSLKDYFENLTLTGTGNINGVGNGLNNQLTGNSGNNFLTGGAGNDTLAGDLGADQFVFGAGSGVDTVSDFSVAQNDRINVHGLTHGVVGGGGIVLSQVGSDTVIDLGGGNIVTVLSALAADVASHMVW